MRQKLAIGLFWKKPCTLKNPTPPTIFASHPSNSAGTLPTKLLRSSRFPIFEFASHTFFRTSNSQNSIEKSTLKILGKILNFLGVIQGENQESGFWRPSIIYCWSIEKISSLYRKNWMRSRVFTEALFYGTAVLPIPRSRLPELRYRF